MKGINLIVAMKNFGFKDGFSFWFKWSFSDPIKMFYWKYITAKPLCTYHGYFLCKGECNHKKIYGRKNIFKYTKELRNKIEVESKTIKGYDEGICYYCGKKGTEIIDDPNWNTLERWLVCKFCKEIIELQRELTFPLTSIERKQQINDRLLQISKETGKPIVITEIDKDKGVSSVEFTGK